MLNMMADGIISLFSIIYDGALYLFKEIVNFLFNKIFSFFSSDLKSIKPVFSRNYDTEKTVLDYINDDKIEGLFSLMSVSHCNAKKLCFNTKEIESLVDYLGDIQAYYKDILDSDYHILTDSITFMLRNTQESQFSVEINKDILFNQILDKLKEEIFSKFDNLKEVDEVHGVHKVLTPVLYSGHFYLLELNLYYLKNNNEFYLKVLDSTIYNSMSHTGNNLIDAIESLLQSSELNYTKNLNVINLKEQHDNYSCGPRVIKMIIDKLKIVNDDILNDYPLLKPILDVEKGANPYKEVVYLLKDADKTKQAKYLMSFLPRLR